jgi:hypothetical protein
MFEAEGWKHSQAGALTPPAPPSFSIYICPASEHSALSKKTSRKEQANMVHDNPLNLYTGPDSLKHYFDPDSAPPLPLVELPPHLNPYHQDGVRIYAKMMTCHPANNVKAMPGEIGSTTLLLQAADSQLKP